jgi:hypothetical protein
MATFQIDNDRPATTTKNTGLWYEIKLWLWHAKRVFDALVWIAITVLVISLLTYAFALWTL